MEIHGSSSAVALLGLEDLVVLAATEVDGKLHQLIETTADRVGCPSCGVVAVPHGRRRVWVRDLPAGGRPVALRWSKRVWRCEDAECERGSWTEASPAIAPRACLPNGPVVMPVGGWAETATLSPRWRCLPAGTGETRRRRG